MESFQTSPILATAGQSAATCEIFSIALAAIWLDCSSCCVLICFHDVLKFFFKIPVAGGFAALDPMGIQSVASPDAPHT